MQGSEIIIDKIHNEVLQRTAGQLENNAVKMVDDCLNAGKSLLHYCVLLIFKLILKTKY